MAMYVVFSLWKGSSDIKVFERRSDAAAYATDQISEGADTADIYEVEAANARAAKAALEMGEGRFIESHGHRATVW
jgi:hypothetical protein